MRVNMKNYELRVFGIHIEDYELRLKFHSLTKLRVTFIMNSCFLLYSRIRVIAIVYENLLDKEQR